MAERNGPAVTVDAIIELPGNRIVLVRRKYPPHGWALPGGFVETGETLEVAVRREAKEETNLDIELLEQFFTYSDPKRDPRQHTVSTVFLARAQGEPRGGDDALEARGFGPEEIPRGELVFEHGMFLDDYLHYRATGERKKP